MIHISKYLTNAFIWGSFNHNGAGEVSILFIYPIKCLNNTFLTYECLLDNAILLIFTSSLLTGFPFLSKAFYEHDLYQKSRLFLHSLTM